ncbi:hypothetical protein ACFOUP_14805 [Belliella kenyensis]|uniref:PepSY domain-containing protein n=1 Tax=Belliella kenyensis TaxID=1472724 RepID=A0ABV8EN25_9BACT|nr:hypothetical protein [Belliella kenyensis]MCH7403407.1 hypothetical protein [Belliella kenyensis]MDN3601619.1 hypothetical protein [Belliella kenyensis]
MKNHMMIAAMFAFGVATTPMLGNATTLDKVEVTINTQDDKTKIEPENLPAAVKKTIKEDAMVSELAIKEAWEGMKESKKYYVVKFDNGGEGIDKKYDAEGNEVKKD